MQDNSSFIHAVKKHDESIAESGLGIWLGAEPTFTDRFSESPEWLSLAAGGEKSQRALAMLRRLCQNRSAKPLILRSIGRQYPGEKLPRWSFGTYESRDNSVIWRGPPDPCLVELSAKAESDLVGGVSKTGLCSASSGATLFHHALTAHLSAHGWSSHCFQTEAQADWRIVFRMDESEPPAFGADDRLTRTSIHAGPVPEEGLSDTLATDGNFLFLIRYPTHNDEVARIELPCFSSVPKFVECLDIIAAAAVEAGLDGLIFEGYPPPVDATVAWATFTPDPAVIEINMAPAKDAEGFYESVNNIYHAAEAEGLSPYRFYYNGDATDSGGGGQITFGGPSAEHSPFFINSWLLPNVVRYFNRHPALSYFFTPSCVGSSSQSPRPDERFRESFAELRLSLELLSRQEKVSPEVLWSSLAPFLSDPSGNNHRSEINIEKLWNPFLTGRGCLGLVEFRAFRMARTPKMLTARAVLFRSILAMLAKAPDSSDLTDWGTDLHDRYALPFYLKQDLGTVLDELNQAGFGLRPVLIDYLMDDDDRQIGKAEINGFQLSVHRALEFWPLVGDVASQESGNSRLIDSSTARIQMKLRPIIESTASDIKHWRIAYKDWQVPARIERDNSGPCLLFAFKYRAFTPWRGLHPSLPPQSPVEFILRHETSGETWKIIWHEWNPRPGPYPSLPKDWAESEQRRNERLLVEHCPGYAALVSKQPPKVAVTPHCLDLRAYPGDDPAFICP